MKGLIKAEFYKQKINGLFEMYLIIMLFAGIGISVSSVLGDESSNAWFWYYNNFISNSMMINIIIAVIASFYYVRDFNDKSIQHALMSGYRRKDAVSAKFIVFNTETIAAFLIYLSSSIITVFVMKGTKLYHSYNISIYKYIFVSIIFKLLFITALNCIYMCFCYLVRNVFAYSLAIFALWASFLGTLYKMNFVKNNIILKNILKLTVNVQDQIMFADRIGNGMYKITGSEAAFFICVMLATAVIFYKLTCSIWHSYEL